MQKWEYKRVFKKTGEVSNIGADRVWGRKISTFSCKAFDIDEIHEDLGSLGRELVNFSSDLNGTQLNYVFNRPIEG